MADRTVTARLVLDTGGYIPAAQAAARATQGLASAQQDAAASTKAATTAQAGSAAAAREAARTTLALSAAKREATGAARDAAAAEVQANAVLAATQKEYQAATADTSGLGAARLAAAKEAMEAAQQEAAAAAEARAASDAQAVSASAALTAHREATSAAKIDAAEAAAAAKVSRDAAKSQTDAYNHTGKVMMGVGVGLVGAFALAEKATMGFDKSMSGVAAVADASSAQMDQLRTAAISAGQATVFSATDAADAEGELVKAGVSVSDVLNGGLQGALSLAAAGQINLADAATYSANAMNVFGLKGSDVTHIADVYAAAANKSAADVGTLAQAMQQGGLVAAQMGMSFEDTTATLAAFSNAGLDGSDAGTSLKTMLEKLAAPSTQASDEMQNLGINVYDAQGHFIGITALAGMLHDKLGPLTDATRNQALATIFGTDAIRSASILYKQGADGMRGYESAVNDNGAAQRMAAEQLNNLSGDLEQLKGSLETTFINGGSGANSVLRDMAKYATDAVNAFGSLPKPLQKVATGFAGGAGGALLLVGGLSTLAGKASGMRKTLSEVSEASSGMKGALASAAEFMSGPWGLAIAGAATVIGIFATNHGKAKIAVDDFTSSIQQDGDAIGKTTTQAVADDLAKKGLINTYKQLGISGGTLTDAILGNAAAMSQVTDATNKAITDTLGQRDFKTMTTQQIGGLNQKAQSYRDLLAAVTQYRGGLAGQVSVQKQAQAATQQSVTATGQSEIATAQATQAAKDAAVVAIQQAAGQRAVADAEIAHKDSAKGVAAAVILESDATVTAGMSAEDHAKAVANAAKAQHQATMEHQIGTTWLLSIADAEAMAGGSARDLDDSVKAEVSAMQDASNTAGDLKNALDALNGVHIAAGQAAIDEQQKVEDLTKALSNNGKTLDITTDKGRANMTAIYALATAANTHAQSVANESGSIAAGSKAMDASRKEFDAVLKQAGLTTDQIDAFNKSLLNTPKLAPIKVTADTTAAQAALQSLTTKFGSLAIHVGGGHALASGYATGGLVVGAGSGTSDSNLVAVSNREYIVRAAAVARPGVLAELNAINFGAGHASVVKPTISMHNLAAPVAASSSGSGAVLNIESYYESGAPPQQVAAELGWLVKARGAAW